jgi:kinesin family member 5
VNDLLQRAENFNETLQVCEDVDKKEFYIRGVKEEIVDDWLDALEKLKRGEINRHYARTVMNHSSSRSHTIFRVYVQSLSGHWNANKN